MSDEIIENEVRFTMRMETGLYNELKEYAKANRRSLAKELEHIVDIHLHQEEPLFRQLQDYFNSQIRKQNNDIK